jgi:hypothetical protein
MDLDRKLELAEAAIKSIAEHDDATAKEVENALSRVASMVKAHGAAAKTRREQKKAGA